MRYSKCMRAGKQFANLKTIVYTQLSKHLVYELGETLYSGPPSEFKEGERNHVSPSVLIPSAAGFKSEEPADWVSAVDKIIPPEDSKSAFPSKDYSRPSPLVIAPNSDTVQSEEKNSLLKDSDKIFSEEGVSDILPGDEELGIKGLKECAHVDSTQNGVALTSENNCDLYLNGDQEISEEMVRLIQEPKSKMDSHPHRRGKKGPKNRIGGVDCVNAKTNSSKSCKQSEKELRNRRVSCLSDRSDSDNSEHCESDDVNQCDLMDNSSKGRKPKNNESLFDENNGSVGGKSNGEMGSCAVNGVNKIKGRRVSRANSDDSDSVSCPKTNGVDVDNDRVDINLLLEISAKDRKLFENKKSKIKRKCADWMLITETEQYYNEKEEILRNKSRDDSDTDTDSSVSCERNNKKIYKKKSSEGKPSRAKKTKTDVEENSASVRKGRYMKKSPSVEDGMNNQGLEFSKCKGKGKSSLERKKEAELKPRKRLSDAERFLRDNKEYYQFPETRDRLRRNTSFSEREHTILEEHENEKNEKLKEETTKIVKSIKSPVKASNEDSPAGNACKIKKSGRSRRPSHKESTDSETEIQEEKETKKLVDNFDLEMEYKTLNGLYFSFEGAPVQESWYQTYQRFIDGAPCNEFIYERDPLKFVLPYEMPKEYFKELHAKKSLLARKRSELADLVRKSPRCHASTLALFSNIFPGKKRKKSKTNKPVKAEEVSSDGTNTPIPEPTKVPLVDAYETEEEMLFIGQCMDEIMKSTVEVENDKKISNKEKLSKKGSSKRRVKGKRTNNSIKVEKQEFPVESKVFDNPLSSEVDHQFLLNLPTYLDEVLIVPDDTLCKNSLELLAESYHCGCTERTSCDEASSADERTEASSETLSICDSETVDSFNSNFSTKVRKLGTHKKRRKNLTGWPTQKKRKPPVTAATTHAASDDNDNSSFSFEDHRRKRRRRPIVKRRTLGLLEPTSDLYKLERRGDPDRRTSARKRSSVLYMDTWPLRFRHH